ncbi:zinc ribbon domain-containing protein [Flavobacterium sp. CBA20B-1]|uniref:zinc ribbon domain-containing protein n=1 Tax=unclassified Flavobacterium TaxID=196869 RepID=UPI00222435DC|nr:MULTISPECIES: zinc ribbon domain-containing protein [unclassified Flavobacterium]WCM42455.1 zinc ribbon domain-containing protein [Flavobacterium sp. CBA20B-1]
MALINCPECERKISNKASSCPNCGYPISAEKEENKPNNTINKSFSKNNDNSFLSIVAIICIVAVIFFLVILNECSSDTNSKEPNSSSINRSSEYVTKNDSGIDDIEKTKVYKNDWKPAGDNIANIGKVLIKNNIYGCGEYYIFEITSNEFAIACTSDGISWHYYVVYPNLDKVYLANEKMYFEKPY